MPILPTTPFVVLPNFHFYCIVPDNLKACFHNLSVLSGPLEREAHYAHLPTLVLLHDSHHVNFCHVGL